MTSLRRRAVLVSLAFLVGLARASFAAEGVREVTILYTNDFHSAIDPIPAYWLPGSPRLGARMTRTTEAAAAA